MDKQIEEVEITQKAIRKSAEGEGVMVDLLNQEMKELQDSQKQIEELTKKTCGQQIYPYGKDKPICWLTKEDCTCRADNQCDHYEVCERIYNAGYRKIPECAVVLTRRAYDGKEIIVEMSGGHKLRLTVGKFGEMCKILEKHTRKETTEKFAERVKMAFYYEFDELIPSIMADKIDEIAKEITEGEV